MVPLRSTDLRSVRSHVVGWPSYVVCEMWRCSVHAPTTALPQVLIYVFDIESHERAKDMKNYTNCIEAIQTNSPDAKVRVDIKEYPSAARSSVWYGGTACHVAACSAGLQHGVPSLQIFVLIHKMDLVAEEKRDAVFKVRPEYNMQRAT